MLRPIAVLLIKCIDYATYMYYEIGALMEVIRTNFRIFTSSVFWRRKRF